MKLYSNAWIALFVAMCAFAQTFSGPLLVSPVQSTHTAIVAQINKDLSTKKLKVGDKVNATVIQDMIASGKIVIPRGSKLIGHVFDVTRFTQADHRSRLALLFDGGTRKGGGALSLRGLIQALAPPLADPRLEAMMSSPSYGGAASGHPVNGGPASGGQTNTPTTVTPSRRRSSVNDLQERQRALDDAEHSHSTDAAPHGALSASSRGIFGLPGLALSSAGPVPVIVAVGQNIELKSGTQIVLRLDGSVQK